MKTFLLSAFCALLSRVYASTDGLHLAKTYPGDTAWPSLKDWQAFNQSIDGNLLTATLPTQICYTGSATQAQCKDARSVHAFEEPTLVEYSWWANNTCPATIPAHPSSETPSCDLASSNYPAYIVRATSASHASIATRFAAHHNIRLSIKNTGHDFLGRNLGHGALSIWTHHIRGAELTDDWRGTGQGAITIGAGMQWKDVYAAAATVKRLVVGGTTNTVGASGGWIMGGGHSALSNKWGLGCDNALEFEVVIPSSGNIVIANTTSNPDLFWALRGGGGSTFGIVTKTTMKTYPQTSLNAVQISIHPDKTGQPGFLKAVAYMMSQAPALADAGFSGYPILKLHSYGSYFTLPGQNWTQINAFWHPFLDSIKAFGVEVDNSTISSEMNTRYFETGTSPNFGTGQGSQSNAVMGSRLIGRQGLGNITAIETMIAALLKDDYIIEPFFYGGQVQRNRNLDTGLNPAWRDAVMHLSILPDKGDDATTKEEVVAVYEEMQKKYMPLLDRLSVDSGAYWNEASFLEKDWKKVFWGTNYDRLRAVKQKYDPDNVLWCFPCVGADVFRLGDDDRLYVAETSIHR